MTKHYANSSIIKQEKSVTHSALMSWASIMFKRCANNTDVKINNSLCSQSHVLRKEVDMGADKTGQLCCRKACGRQEAAQKVGLAGKVLQEQCQPRT